MRSVLPAYLGLVLIGGTNFVAVRFSDFELPPFWGAALRFLGAAIIFFLIATVRRTTFPRGKALIGSVMYGILGFGASYAFAYYALVAVTAGFSSIIYSLVPLATLTLASIGGQEDLKPRAVFGGTIALLGTAIAFEQELSLNIPTLSFLALLGGVVTNALTPVVIKHFPRSDLYATNATAMSTGSLILLAISWLAGERWSIPERTTTLIAYGYLVVFGSVALFALYLFVLSKWTATATNYGFVLSPPVTIIVGAVLVGESVSPVFVIGSLLVLLGVYFGALSRSNSSKK